MRVAQKTQSCMLCELCTKEEPTWKAVHSVDVTMPEMQIFIRPNKIQSFVLTASKLCQSNKLVNPWSKAGVNWPLAQPCRQTLFSAHDFLCKFWIHICDQRPQISLMKSRIYPGMAQNRGLFFTYTLGKVKRGGQSTQSNRIHERQM